MPVCASTARRPRRPCRADRRNRLGRSSLCGAQLRRRPVSLHPASAVGAAPQRRAGDVLHARQPGTYVPQPRAGGGGRPDWQPQLGPPEPDDARQRWVLDQLRPTNDIIRATAGVSPKVFRPPFGATSPRIRGLVRSSGMTHILWTTARLKAARCRDNPQPRPQRRRPGRDRPAARRR
jgi:hypothetical protein